MANKKMTIIASKGSLDMAYPPLILATTAAAMDVDVCCAPAKTAEKERSRALRSDEIMRHLGCGFGRALPAHPVSNDTRRSRLGESSTASRCVTTRERIDSRQ